jgi:dihydrofolate reductase
LANHSHVPKFVASRTLEVPLPWNGALLDGDVPQAVAALKEQAGEEFLISAQLVNVLLEHDLIDRYQLMIFPVTIGAGKRLFAQDDGLKAFTLSEAVTTSTGLAILTYELGAS